MSKVLDFPKLKNVDKLNIQNTEDVNKHMENVRVYHVDETIEIMTEFVFHQLVMCGFNIDSDDDDIHKDIFLSVESMKSMLLKYYSIKHPLQIVAEDMFEREEDGNYKMKEDDDTL